MMRKLYNVKSGLALVGLVALMALGAACSTGAASPSTSGVSGLSSGQVADVARALQAGGVSLGYGESGIWVSGQGSVTIQPDLVVLSVGVETTGVTVAQARDEAAAAMDAIVKALKDRGVADRDIQTAYYSISPRYEYGEQIKDGIRTGRQILVGYTVSNSATVKLRDLNGAGSAIDAVTAAGGDLVRINSIRFTVDDPKPYAAQLREAAVKDALAKAQQYASLSGVTLGKLVLLTESGGSVPTVQLDYARASLAESGASVETPISGGELQLTMYVQAAFAIE